MMATNKNYSAVNVQSKISIITEGRRGVSVHQAINLPDADGYAVPANRNITVTENEKRLKSNINDSKKLAISDRKTEEEKFDRNHPPPPPHHHHHHHHQQRRDKAKVNSSSKQSGHGKPSSVKSRNSSKKSKQSSRKSSTYSEPNPVLPGEDAKNLADLLLEKLSSGSNVSSRKYKDDKNDNSDSTIRLSTFEDKRRRSMDDLSFLENISNKGDGSKKFTYYDGRPLTATVDKQQAEPSRGVRFERPSAGNYYDKGKLAGETYQSSSRQQNQQYAPLSVQLAMSDKYVDEIKRNERANQALQKPRIPVKPDAKDNEDINTLPKTYFVHPGQSQRNTKLNDSKTPLKFPNDTQSHFENERAQFQTNDHSRTRVQQEFEPTVYKRNILEPGFSFDNTEVITIKMRPQSMRLSDDFQRHYMRSSFNAGNSGVYEGRNGKEFYTVV